MPTAAANGRLLGADGTPYRFGYDAVDDKKRRLAPRMVLQSEDAHLDATKRKKLVGTARDLARNYTLAAWACRCHVAYISTFALKTQTGNAKVDQQLTDLVFKWSNRLRFDVRQRDNLARFLRISEIRRVLDGDVFWHKLADGSVAPVESDRVRTPTRSTQLPAALDLSRVTHGVWTTATGRTHGYCLHNRGTGGRFTFARVLKARHVLPHGYWDRFDQVRGVSPMAPAINQMQDVYESLTYAVCKAKIGQLFGLAIHQSQDREDATGDVETTDHDDGTLDKSETEIDFGKAPYILDLYPDEKVETIETAQPSNEFAEFMRLLIMVSLRALDIPQCFWDESTTNYSGQRQAWVTYDRMADAKRDDNRELLNCWLAWRATLGILDGELVLPKSMKATDLRWFWVDRGIPWIDPLKEVKADALAVEKGFASTPGVCMNRGQDAYTIANEEAEFQDHRRGLGLPSTTPTATPPPQESSNAR